MTEHMYTKQLGAKQYACIHKSHLNPDSNVIGYVLDLGGKKPLQQRRIKSLGRLMKSLISEYIYIDKKDIYIGVLTLNLKMYVLCTFAFLLLIGSVFLIRNIYYTDSNNVSESITTESATELQEIVKRSPENTLFVQYSEFTIKNNVNIPLQNDITNSVIMVYTVKDEEGNALYTSEHISPGEQINWYITDYFAEGEYLITFEIRTYDENTNLECEGYSYDALVTIE